MPPTLRDHFAEEASLSQISHCPMRVIRASFMQIRPSQETPGPISLPGFMIGDEFVVIDGSVRLVQGICSGGATIIGQARRYRDTRSSEQNCAAMAVW